MQERNELQLKARTQKATIGELQQKVTAMTKLEQDMVRIQKQLTEKDD